MLNKVEHLCLVFSLLVVSHTFYILTTYIDGDVVLGSLGQPPSSLVSLTGVGE